MKVFVVSNHGPDGDKLLLVSGWATPALRYCRACQQSDKAHRGVFRVTMCTLGLDIMYFKSVGESVPYLEGDGLLLELPIELTKDVVNRLTDDAIAFSRQLRKAKKKLAEVTCDTCIAPTHDL